MAKPRNKVVDYLQYLAVRLLAVLVYAMPLRRAYEAAAWVGDMIHRLDKRHRDRAIRHLKLSFPDWSEARCDEVARHSMRSMAFLGLETLLTPRILKPTTWLKHIHTVNAAENVRLMVERPTPLIYVVAHFGNWEVLGYSIAMLGFRNFAIARRMDNPHLNEFVLGVRERSGQVIIDKKGATEAVGPLLDQKAMVCFIADQDAGRKGMFVDFFGRKASTYKSIALLAMQYECPVIVTYAKRVGETFRFEAGVKRVIHPSEWADKDDPTRWLTQEYTRELENVIRDCPEQYLWTHRRWKHRPKGEIAPEDGIA